MPSLPSLPSMPALPSLPSIPVPKLPFNPESIPFIGDLLKKLPFFSSGEAEGNVTPVNESGKQGGLKANESLKPEGVGKQNQTNQTNQTVPANLTKEVVKISKLIFNPLHADYNRSTGRWDVIFKLDFVTNIKEEEGSWQVFLYSDGIVDKRTLDTVDIDDELEGFSTNYALKQVKEGENLKIKMVKEVRLLQPGGSTAASYEIEKEKEISLSSQVEVVNSKVSCGRIDFELNFSGLIPPRLTAEIKLPGKTFSKTFRITGGESIDVNFDSNLNRDIFDVRNGKAEIHLNLEKFLRIAATPEGGGEISIKSSKVLSSLSFDKPNVTAKSESGRIILENANGSLPIYIDSIVLIEENSRSIGVGRILCDKVEVEKSYHGRILVIGGPNLFWNDYKERYQTKKPEFILFDGEI
ncbi:MAG: hypothetical protein H0Z28_09440 [Archaeoglobus sp.]|nr:hypothetical protein [Archaeoglobus sp.]